ncbi:MAG: hypothetical protein EP319_07720 [Deltaproteobacteria bacterium]|nr:MAG: hypothetical protein EP319_07720 [Deltaproteobacteria bacterium]
MKKLFILLLLSQLLTPAFAADFMEGTFLNKKITNVVVPTQDDCEGGDDGARWDAESENCLVDIADVVKIKKNEDKYSVEVITWGGNLHSCAFENEAEKIAEGHLQAKTEGSEWVDGDWQDKECVVDIKFKDQNTLSVEANWACQVFCGMRAELSIEEAKRN